MSGSNPPIPVKAKPPASGVFLSYRYTVRVLVLVVAALSVSLMFNVIFLFVQKKQAEAKPWVVAVNTEGAMTDLFLRDFEVTPDLVYQYLGYVIPRLYFVNMDKQPGIEDLRRLVDDRILRKETDSFQQSAAYTLSNEVVMQAQPVRLLVGTPGNRAFAISDRYKKVFCMVEGRFSLTSKQRNYSDPIRWDIELEIVAPTQNNRWGLRLVQIYERSVDFAPLEIPQVYFEK